MRPSVSMSVFARMSRAAGTAQNTKGRNMGNQQYGTDRIDQLSELKRELQARQSIYPSWIRKGRISKELATHRLNCLQAVIDDFEARHAPKSQQGSLGL